MGPGDYWYNHDMWLIIPVYFFPTKTMENKTPENTAPGTKFASDFCASIGPRSAPALRCAC